MLWSRTLLAVAAPALVPVGASAFPINQSVFGIPLSFEISIEYIPRDEGSQARVGAFISADLSNLQNKIVEILQTLPLPSDPCAESSIGNTVLTIKDGGIAEEKHDAVLRIAGTLEVWACMKDAIPSLTLKPDATDGDAQGWIPSFNYKWGPSSPIKTMLWWQDFEARLPISVEVYKDSSIRLLPGHIEVELVGNLTFVVTGALMVDGQDAEALANEALQSALGNQDLLITLPGALAQYQPLLSDVQFNTSGGHLAAELKASLVPPNLFGLFK